MAAQGVNKLVFAQSHHNRVRSGVALDLPQDQPLPVARKCIEVCRLSKGRNGDTTHASIQGIPEVKIIVLVEPQIASVWEIAWECVSSLCAQSVDFARQCILVGVPLEGQFGGSR